MDICVAIYLYKAMSHKHVINVAYFGGLVDLYQGNAPDVTTMMMMMMFAKLYAL